MPRVVEEKPLTRHTLNLYAGDYEKLQALSPEQGAGVVIRRIVHKFIRDLEEKSKAIKE